jgi:threonine dehydrogenase-like Zn-dependent dehydrogenase
VRAFVLRGPGRGGVQDVPAPEAGPGEAVIDVERVGLCGTDAEFFSGEMAYLHQGHASYPMRLGHEWCGIVRAVGAGADPDAWVGRRVMGDTMLGCGECRRCRRGHQHVCAGRTEVGVRGGRAGALAEQLAVPVLSLYTLPAGLDETVGALVEPGANALRAAAAAGPAPGQRILVMGPGAIGSLAALFLRAEGAEVHLMGLTGASMDFVRGLGFEHVWTRDSLSDLPFDAVVDATNAPGLPALAVDLVEPAGRVVFIGLSGTPSLIDTRAAVLKDVTVTGILSGSGGIPGAIEAFGSQRVDPRPLVGAIVSLEEAGDVLAGRRPAGAGAAPKIHVDPRA